MHANTIPKPVPLVHYNLRRDLEAALKYNNIKALSKVMVNVFEDQFTAPVNTLLASASAAALAANAVNGQAIAPASVTSAGPISGTTGTFSGLVIANRINITGTHAAGTYSAEVIAVAGADRDIMRIGVSGFTNGFSVRYIGGSMLYSFESGSVAVAGTLITGSYTVATLPANAAAGLIYVTNEVGGAVHAFSDGSVWRRCTDRAIIS